jgi:Tol biopolymer transport system component
VKDALILTNAPLLSWSADSKSLFTLDPPNANARVYAVARVSAETGEKQQVTFPPTKEFGELAVAASPDGHAFVFTRQVNGTVMDTDLCVVALSSESLPVRAPEIVLSGARIEGIA